MKLLMQIKGKVKDNYLFNLKLTVNNRIKNVMSCCIDLHYLLHVISTVACQEIEVVRFIGCFHLYLFLSYVNKNTRSNLSKTYYQIRSTRFPKEKANFLPPRSLFSSLITNNKTRCTYSNPLMPDEGQLAKPTAKS